MALNKFQWPSERVTPKKPTGMYGIDVFSNRYTLPLLGVANALLVEYSITFLHLKLYPIITLRATSRRKQGMKSMYRINIQDILEHLKFMDTCTITMMRLSSTFNR